MKQIKIAVIGHVDHGKSTLLGRLLFDSDQVKPEKIAEVKKLSSARNLEYSFFLDNFEEERIGNMTIDVCYVRYQSPSFEYTFIDTPGHKEFIKNMLSGASRADAAVLLVSTVPSEGIREQTKRHLRLAKLLGINQLVVAINKMDLVDYDQTVFEKIKHELSLLLKKIGFESAKIPMIPVSAAKGVNVYHQSGRNFWYQGRSLIEEMDNYFKPVSSLSRLPLRFVVQDVYPFFEQMMVVGKVETGLLKKGEKIIFNPSGIKSLVETIKLADKEKDQVGAGEAVGLLLRNWQKGIGRGEVIGPEGNPPSSCREFIAQIYLIEKIKDDLKGNFLLRCGMAEGEGKIKKVFSNRDGFAKVKIIIKKPMVVERYRDFPSLGRFILVKDKKNVALGVRV